MCLQQLMEAALGEWNGRGLEAGELAEIPKALGMSLCLSELQHPP